VATARHKSQGCWLGGCWGNAERHRSGEGTRILRRPVADWPSCPLPPAGSRRVPTPSGPRPVWPTSLAVRGQRQQINLARAVQHAYW